MMGPKKIKIVHVLHSVGGVDVSLRLILDHLDIDKFENIVIHGQNDTTEEFRDKSGKVIKEYKLDIQRNLNVIRDIKSLVELNSILKEERPNLIHAHSSKGGVLAKIVGHLKGIPVLHTPQAFSYLSSQGVKRKIYLFVEKLMSQLKFNKILASSESELDRARNEIGYKQEQTLLFNNCITLKEISELSIEKTWPDKYICSVGRPSYQKNIEMMIDIVARVKDKEPDIHLVLMGVGLHSPNLNVIIKQINDYKLNQNVTLLNWTNRNNILNIIKHSMFYISTARYEGLPYSIIESLALSKPIIATNVDGNRDLVIDKYNGVLIDEKDLIGFEQTILELWKNQERRELLSGNSKILFDNHFNIEKNIKTLESIYERNKIDRFF